MGVVVIGSFNIDHVWSLPELPRPGETRSGTYRTGPGGKGFNQATAAARAGAATTFICALGSDAGGTLARSLATGDGIDLRAETVDAPTGTAGIYVDHGGLNSIVIGPGANARLSPRHIQAQADALSTARVVLAQMESPLDAVVAGFTAANAAGALAMLNPAPADALVPASLLARCDLITPNESEFCAQLACHCGEHLEADGLAGLGDDRLHALCRRLLPHGTVVITLGAAGCFASHADPGRHGDDQPFRRVPAFPARAVDTTGAGDAFSGALAASIAAGGARFSDHLEFASRYAGKATEKPGAADAMPRREELAD